MSNRRAVTTYALELQARRAKRQAVKGKDQCRLPKHRYAKRAKISSATSCAPISRPAGIKTSLPGSRPNRTAICISATPSRSVSTSASPRNFPAAVICASTTPTRPRKSRNISTPSSATCAGSASTGASIFITRPTISSASTSGRKYLIRAGKAYVDDQTQEETRLTRGTLTEAGTESPYRGRSVEENLDLFRRMRAGEFPNGARVLRAKIDMASGNINLRDPVLYRILHAEHPRTGTAWCIYPSYDFAHGQSDAIEGITHSICTLEFEDHRPLYDWFLDNLPVPSHPHQYEFARLNLTYTVLSKRVLTELVRGGHVGGWDDPRMPTLAGLRRRGVPPAAIRDFIKRIGVAKANSVVDVGMLEFSIREHLNRTAQRRMAVLRPLKVVIENYPEGQSEEVEAVNHPEDASAGTRRLRFGRELFIERDDFMEDPPKKFFRLAPGREVRLRYAYFITCREVVKDQAGEVVELRCTYDPATKGGNAPDGRKVKATLHWVSAADAVPAEVRLYNPLFLRPDPNAANFAADLNPQSLEVIAEARVEPTLAEQNSADAVQFERLGYFSRDRIQRLTGLSSTAPSVARQLGQGRRRQLNGVAFSTSSLAIASGAGGRRPTPRPGFDAELRQLRTAVRHHCKMIKDCAIIPPEQPHQLALNAHAVGRQDAYLISGVGGFQRNRGAAPPETLQRRFLVVDQGDDNVAGVGGVAAFHQRDVAVEDSRFDHRIAAHFEREMLARGQ